MRKGIYCSLLSSFSFALLYYTVTLMAPLSGLELLGVRSVILLPALMLIFFLLRLGYQVDRLISQIKARKKLLLVPLSTAALVGACNGFFFGRL